MTEMIPIPDELLHRMAEKFRLLGDATRLAILRSLQEGEKSVGRVVDDTRSGQANVSKHLKLMHEAGLVSRRKVGLQVFYRVSDPLVARLCSLVCDTVIEETRAEATRAQPILREAGRLS
jgi:DNA-binding transcriptional ArsR family regulator